MVSQFQYQVPDDVDYGCRKKYWVFYEINKLKQYGDDISCHSISNRKEKVPKSPIKTCQKLNAILVFSFGSNH